MPKVNIYSTKTHPGHGEQRYRCEVGWARGEDVTIAVTRLADGADPTEEFFAPGTPAPNTITISGGVNTATQTTAAYTARFTGPDGAGELIPSWQGWHMPLDRSHINMLIRELRKARDAAYGRDE